jgi:hypothetical protein
MIVNVAHLLASVFMAFTLFGRRILLRKGCHGKQANRE